jgi:hypothetical protein
MTVKRFPQIKLDPVILLILALASFLFFYRLDHRPFWQDEAETANLARNVLKYGVPLAFDGKNLISQEGGWEFGPDHLWRWSPWLQIYVAAASFRLGGLTTAAGRFPFALCGLLTIVVVFLLVKRYYVSPGWARASAALLASSVPFLLFSRQCRYYGLGALLVALTLLAFRGNWQSRRGPAALLTLALALLFYTNYVLFFSYAAAFLFAALLVYRSELPPARTLLLALFVGCLVLPGFLLFPIGHQSAMVDLPKAAINLVQYYGSIFDFMIPVPVALGLAWRWRSIKQDRARLRENPGERFILFLVLIVFVNTAMLSLSPNQAHRYLLHLYPLCALTLGWVAWQVFHFHKFSGVLLAFLLIFTNWLYMVPIGWLGFPRPSFLNDLDNLTYPNLPLKLYLTELASPYPDVNQSLIDFFQAHARPGDTILTTYGDLPLQFYTPFKVVGGLQWSSVPPPGQVRPDWVVKRFVTRCNREEIFNPAEEFILKDLRLYEDYQAVVLPYPDEMFGNRPDPYYHHFLPPAEPFIHLTLFQKRGGSGP